MPIYEYRCKECEHEVEALQKLSDPPLVDCPACGKPALQKRVSAAGFQLKGSGWYVTDFRGSAGAGKKAPKEGDKPDAPAGDAAKSDAKAESTTKSEAATPAASTTTTTPSTSSES